MGAQTGSQYSVAFTTSLPATIDAAGFAALDFSAGELGELQTISGGGINYTEVEHNRLNDRETEILLGNFTREPFDITVAADESVADTANQDALAAENGTAAGVSVRIRNGQAGVDRFYVMRVVNAGDPSVDGANSVVTRAYRLRPLYDAVKAAV